MQADDFDSGKFVEFSSDEYKSMIIGVKASESERIVIDPGIDRNISLFFYSQNHYNFPHKYSI